ncbi:MAG: T9SS type A sorting domain-containing protein [candidate division KSB1 bacterium]|nr:T9SS type A sorting domain-containing protein [candidate division KSB1 bacterium]
MKGMLRTLVLCCLTFVASTVQAEITPEMFENPESTQFPMQIYVTSVSIDAGFNETNLVAGDKIGAFDTVEGNEICVGMKTLTSSYTSMDVNESILWFEAYKAERSSGLITELGFIEGHRIKLAVYKAAEDEVYVFNDEELTNLDPSTSEEIPIDSLKYEGQGTAAVEINAEELDLDLSVNDETMGDILAKFTQSAAYSAADPSYNVQKGDTVWLAAASKDAVLYEFIEWTWDAESDTNETVVFIMEEDESYTANFEQVIPVELAAFSVTQSVDGVLLTWQTATETNNYGFQIQRAGASQADWQVIGFVPGAGTSSAAKEYSFLDTVPASDRSYYYRLKQVDTDGSFEYSPVREFKAVPHEFALQQNFPNPFNPQTTISYELKKETHVTLEVYDLLGKRIQVLIDRTMPAGSHHITLNASQMSAGTYFYKMSTGPYTKIRKMTLIK